MWGVGSLVLHLELVLWGLLWVGWKECALSEVRIDVVTLSGEILM